MKPIGTITMCFPHVDEETRSVLQSIMDEAENYTDFTERLCDRVCEEPSPPLLEYFAVFFPFHINYYSLIKRLDSAGKVSDLAEPLFLFTRVRRDHPLRWDEMKESIVKALDAASNDWIASHLYLAWRIQAELVFSDSDVDIRPIEAIASSVDENMDLAFFKSYILRFKAWRYLRENKREEAMDQLKQALVIARKFDEQIMIADCLCEIAGLIIETDVKQSIDLFISSRELSEQLGYRAGIGSVQLQLGFIMELRGELAAAIEYQFEQKAVLESLGHTTERMDSSIASLYNQAGNGEKAFQLAKTMVDRQAGRPAIRYLSFSHANLAWALINLGKHNEAKTELASAHELATKSGTSGQMMWVRMVEGILDKAENSFDAAIICFEEVLKYLEDTPTSCSKNICLLNLTEIEIELLSEESLDEKLESSGPWMQNLVEHAENNDLPGIAAHALLLKAELRRKQGRIDDVRKILKEVGKTAEAPSMKHLNDMLISKFPDIIVT